MKKNLILWIASLFLIASFLFAIKNIWKNPLTNDSYLHLGIGKYIVQNSHIPRHDDISFKAVQPAMEFIAHSWLSDEFFYLAYKINPLSPAIILSLTVMFTGLMIFIIAKKIQASLTLKFLTIGLFFMVSPIFYRLHPFIFDIILLLYFSYIHISWINKENEKLLFVPLIFLAFANLSGGFIFILAIFFLLIIGIEMIGLIIKKIKLFDYLKLCFSFIAGLFISLANPLFHRIWVYFLTFIIAFSSQNKQTSQLAITIKLINQNYLKENVSSSLYIVFMLYMLFVFGLFIWLIISNPKKFVREIFHYIPYLLMFFFAMQWFRFIPMITALTIPLFLKIISYVHENYLKNKYHLLLLLILICLLLSTLFLIFNQPASLNFIPPKSQVEIINKYNLPDNVITSYDITGYKFFKNTESRSFIDAQDDLFDENETINFYTSYQNMPDDYLTNFSNHYNVGTILVSKDIDSLVQPLSLDLKDWALIYLDSNGLLYVKKDLMSKSFIDSHGFKYVDMSRNLGFDPQKSDQAAEELTSFIKQYPKATLAVGQLASIYRIKHKYALAEKTLQKIPEKDWDYVVKIEMGRIKAAEGLCLSSEHYYLSALKERPEKLFSRAVLDLAVLYAGCFGDKNKATHYFQRYQSFPLSSQERELVRELMLEFSIKTENNN